MSTPMPTSAGSAASGATMTRQAKSGARVGAYGALPHHRKQACRVARDRAARGRLRRPIERRQVDRDQRPDAAEAPRLRVEDARPHAAHQPVRARSEARRRRVVRRPARLRLRCGRTQRQAALAGGDGRVPRGAAQPQRDRRPGRRAAWLHRDRSESPRLRRAAPGERIGQAARAGDEGRQAQPARDERRAGGGTRSVRARSPREESEVALAAFSSLSRIGVADAARVLYDWTHPGSPG